VRPLWLLGCDVAASPSPALHHAGLQALGLPPCYALHPVEPDAVDAAFDEAERDCRGINVTAPYKLRAAARFAAVLDDTARACGAVNTVVFDAGRAVRAANTDVHGLLVAWHRASVDVDGRTVAIVGAGGAARAAVVAARDARARAVAIYARRLEARRALEVQARALGLALADGPAQLVVLASTELADPAAAIAAALRGPGTVHDVRYGAAARASRDAALRAGHVYLDGTSMLLAQGQAALALFLGGTLPDRAALAMSRAVSSWRTTS
jgi:shikimate dehydrogenase